jgi:hypothetical protein
MKVRGPQVGLRSLATPRPAVLRRSQFHPGNCVRPLAADDPSTTPQAAPTAVPGRFQHFVITVNRRGICVASRVIPDLTVRESRMIALGRYTYWETETAVRDLTHTNAMLLPTQPAAKVAPSLTCLYAHSNRCGAPRER